MLSLAALLSAGCTALREEAPGPGGGTSSPLVTKAVNTTKDADPHSVLVKLSSAAGLEAVAGIPGVKSLSPIFPSPPGNGDLEERFGLNLWHEAVLEEGVALEELASSVAGLPCVARIEFNTAARRPEELSDPVPVYDVPATRAGEDEFKIFNDPQFSNQWHYINVGDKNISENAYAGGDISVKDVWKNITCGDSSIIVAVVDEGVKYTHPDLAAAMWTNSGEIPDNGIDDDGNGYVDDVHGYNFVSDGAVSWTAKDDTGHGTHTAGTIAAVNNNGIGVVGVAGGSGKGDGVRIMSCIIFGDEDDRDGVIHQLKQSGVSVRKPEEGTEPHVYYVGKFGKA